MPGSVVPEELPLEPLEAPELPLVELPLVPPDEVPPLLVPPELPPLVPPEPLDAPPLVPVPLVPPLLVPSPPEVLPAFVGVVPELEPVSSSDPHAKSTMVARAATVSARTVCRILRRAAGLVPPP